MYYNRRTDANQQKVIDRFRLLGASCFATSRVGFSFPDLVIGYRGMTGLVEVKRPKGKLSPGQKRFSDEWRGGTVFVAWSEDDCAGILDQLGGSRVP
jgi:hypothetical protein